MNSRFHSHERSNFYKLNQSRLLLYLGLYTVDIKHCLPRINQRIACFVLGREL